LGKILILLIPQSIIRLL